MKTIHICHPGGKTEIMYAPFTMGIREIAKDYPAANVFWLGASPGADASEYSVIRYIPE